MSAQTLERISRLQARIASHNETIDAALSAAADDDRNLTDSELATLGESRSEVEAMTSELEQLVRFHNTVAGADALAPVQVPQARAYTQPRSAGEQLALTRSVGEQFVMSEEFGAYKGSGQSRAVGIDDIMPSAYALGETRATMTEGAAPWATVIGTTGTVGATPKDKPRPLLDVISRAPTDLAAVPVLTISGDESGAAVVSEGALKPEVTWTESIETISVPTIAGHKKASRQILDDVALVRNLIDAKLTNSVLNAVEASIMTAVNAALGVGNTTTGGETDALLSVVRQAVGELQARGHTPNAVMLNPADYASLDLSVLGSTLLGPVVGSQFWGLRPVPNANLSAGSAVVGDFAEAVTLYERSGISMFVTDSDISGEGAQATSDFRRNILTFLAEIRAVPVVLDASALEAAVLFSES